MLMALLLGAALAGSVRELHLDHALHPVPRGVPDAVVRMPDVPPRQLVLYLHGWESCARGVALGGRVDCGDGTRVDGQGVAARAARGAPDAAIVVPQLAYLHRGGNPGAWRVPSHPAAWLQEVDAQVGLGAAQERLTVVAHSGGYVAAAALLRADPGLGVDTVVLLDALYGDVDDFAAWLCGGPGRVLVSLHTAHAGTTRRNQELAAATRACRGPKAVRVVDGLPAGGLADTPLLVVRTPVAHGALPVDRLTPILAGLQRRGRPRPPTER